jgi:hypothetical protein
LDDYRSYKITDAGGVDKHLAVVRDGAGAVKKPTGAGVGLCVGFTQEKQATQNRGVRLKVAGYTFAVAAAAITAGDAVDINGTTGKIRSAQTRMNAGVGTADIVNVVGYAETAAGADGDIIEVRIAIFTVKQAVS